MALIRGLACSRRTEQGSLEVLVFATMGVKKCGGRLQGSWHRILSLSYLRDVLAKWVLLQSAVCPLLLLLALFHLLSKDDLFWFSTGVFSSLSKRFGRFFFQRFGRFVFSGLAAFHLQLHLTSLQHGLQEEKCFNVICIHLGLMKGFW